MNRFSIILISLIFFVLPSVSLAGGLSFPDNVFQVRLVGERVDYSYVGNPAQLFIDQWLAGEVILEDGQRRKVDALMYNGFHDELVYLSGNQEYIKLEKSRLKGFILENHFVNDTLYFEKIQVPSPGAGNTASRYAQVLHQGALSLYASRQIKSAGKEIIHQQNRAFERRLYKPDTSYLLQLPDGRWYSFSKLRRRTLQELFPDKRDQIRSIQRSNQIRMRNNEQELIRLIRLLEPLW